MRRSLSVALPTLLMVLTGCSGEDPGVSDPDLEDLPPGEACEGDDEDLTRPNGWRVASHCKGEEPSG